MSQIYTVKNGPFKGVDLDTSMLVPWRYASGQAVVIDGKEMMEWGLDYLTPIFLEVFEPSRGWAVATNVEMMAGVSLPDYQNPMILDGKTVTNSFGGDVPSQLQVMKVTAELTDPANRLIQRTVVLQGIHNLSSGDLGVKKALLQLYRAMGLPSSPAGSAHQMDQEPIRQRQPAASNVQSPETASASINNIRPISVTKSVNEGEDDAGDDNVLGPHGPSSVAPAADEQSAVAAPSVDIDEDQLQATENDSESSVDNSHINARVLAQIEHYASIAGLKVRHLTDDADAKQELVRVRKASNARN